MEDGVPYDKRLGIVPNVNGRVTQSELKPGCFLYTMPWHVNSISHLPPSSLLILPPSIVILNANTIICIWRIWWWDSNSRFVNAIITMPSAKISCPLWTCSCRSVLQWLGKDRSSWSDPDYHEQCLWNSRGYSGRLQTRYMHLHVCVQDIVEDYSHDV